MIWKAAVFDYRTFDKKEREMYARDIVTEGIKPLDYNDTGENAIVHMHEYNVNQLPVTEDGRYIGILSLDDIITLKHLNDPLKTLKIALKRPYVTENAHLYDVMKAAVEHNAKVVPVLSKDDTYLGLITAESSLKAVAKMQSVMDEGGMLTLSVPVRDYQLSPIARIVEDNGANILNLYTEIDQKSGTVDVTMKLNTIELSPIIAAFERYEYEVKDVRQDQHYQEDVKDRYDAFMKYLNV
ncbi:MAG: CBS domain-containing protein [Bacteroidetes bacterium]|nr:CBS domain-containing protein [Bacteroidota bacterium]